MGGRTTKNYITNVTKTGLGDSQYSGIMSGQGEIKTNQAGITSDIGALQSSQDTGFTGVQTGFDDLNTYLGAQFQGANDQRFDYAKANAEAQKYLNDQAIARENLATDARTQMGTQIDTGFNDMGGRFDTVDTNVGNVQSAVDQGFVDQAAGFADAQTEREFALNANKQDRKNNFDATLLEMDANKDEQNRANQLVLEGQTGIGTTLGEMGTAADTYAAQSLENQGNIQSGIDTAASTFDTYVDRYSDDQTLAQQTRADMQTANANAARDMQNALAQGQQQQTQQQQQVQNQIQSGFNQNQAGQQAITNQQQNFANQQASAANQYNNIKDLQNQLASGVDQLDGGQVRAAAEMAKFASAQTDLSLEQRQEFNAIGTAFDENGQLITNGIDAQGNQIQRSIAENGNMIINTVNAAGQIVGTGQVNINNALQRLSELPMLQGGNAQMGNLTAPLNYGQYVDPNSGIMSGSPYAQTQ